MRSQVQLGIRLALLVGAGSLLLGVAHSQTLSGSGLVHALENGGYVIVMRHASSPREVPDQRTANADNVHRERQLDETGRSTAKAMGEALHRLQIPIGEVFSSPTYRALETIRLLGLPSPKVVPELNEGSQGMQGGVTEEQTAWLQSRAKEFEKGTNILVVTHFPNMTRAFPQWTSGLGDGEALVIGPDGRGGTVLIARVKIDEWPRLQP